MNKRDFLLAMEYSVPKRLKNGLHYAYQDSLGLWTIGPGILIDKSRGGGLTDDEISYVFSARFNMFVSTLVRRYSWFSLLDEVRQAVVTSMAYQLGEEELFDYWPHFQNCMAVRDYLGAAKEMRSSKAAQQTPERWNIESTMMETGQWPTL